MNTGEVRSNKSESVYRAEVRKYKKKYKGSYGKQKAVANAIGTLRRESAVCTGVGESSASK